MLSGDVTGPQDDVALRPNRRLRPSRRAGFKGIAAKDRIAEFIRTRVLEGYYQAGHYLSETTLQRDLHEAQLEFSRVPIREALRALEAEKLVDIVPNRGTFICDMGPEAIEEILQTRLIIEQHVARTLALHPRTNLAEAERLNRAMRQITLQETSPQRRFEFIRLDGEFHCTLSTLAGFESTFTELLRTTRNRFRLITFPGDPSLDRPYSTAAVREHQAILKALRPRNRGESWGDLMGNARQAEAAVRRHLQNSLKRWNIPVLDKQRIQKELPGLFRIQYCSLDHDADSPRSK